MTVGTGVVVGILGLTDGTPAIFVVIVTVGVGTWRGDSNIGIDHAEADLFSEGNGCAGPGGLQHRRVVASKRWGVGISIAGMHDVLAGAVRGVDPQGIRRAAEHGEFYSISQIVDGLIDFYDGGGGCICATGLSAGYCAGLYTGRCAGQRTGYCAGVSGPGSGD